jgi:hypothetical protein
MGGVPPYVALATVLAKNYTAMEHNKIRGACTLSLANYDVYVPPKFVTEILSEGQTVKRIQAILQDCLNKLDQNTDHLVYIHLTRDTAAQDIKEVLFRYGGDNDYTSCHHRGRLSRVSHLTSADTRDLETSPGLCSTIYDALLRVLLAYITFLKLLFGGYCAHCLGGGHLAYLEP